MVKIATFTRRFLSSDYGTNSVKYTAKLTKINSENKNLKKLCFMRRKAQSFIGATRLFCTVLCLKFRRILKKF
ncbi:MAG: hypothetical protein L6V93_06520 [Clostridiales bacterium]|nr:MAG: hypothetical protein L6V93_06520 [Clostridiales bacterium]